MDREKQGVYKKIYDPVHGFIRLSLLERDLIDSFAFQRLHYIHQLGVSYLVYPGASHTRFEHSLGVMAVATEIFDRIVEHSPYRPDEESLKYWRQVVRFAALCHDLGHLPFSHVAEKRILGSEGHEMWTLALIESSFLSPIWEKLMQMFSDRGGVKDVIKISIGEAKLKSIRSEISFSPWERVMSQIVTGDFFGADRIDYLLRDARCTGVSYGLFDYHQLIEMLRIVPTEEGAGLTLGVEENGIESCEALILARHFMHKRVYQHPSVQAYSFHMARFMEKIYRRDMPLLSLGKYLSYTDNEILSELKVAFLDPSHIGHEDAIPLFVRENRYIAVELPEKMGEQEVLNWKKRCNIAEERVEFFLSEEAKKHTPSFAVLQGHKVAHMTKETAPSAIPAFSKNWLYVSPQYGDLVGELLN
jgi:HD superfamily phosphohydrolase